VSEQQKVVEVVEISIADATACHVCEGHAEESSVVLCCLPAIETEALRPGPQELESCAGAQPSPPAGDRQAEAWERQADARQAERAFRKHAVAFSHWAQDCGVTLETAADGLDLSTRTLSRWRHGWNTDRLALRPRGRPCRCAAPEVREDVVAFLDDRGPGIGLPALQHHYPRVARAELIELLSDYRGDWRLAHIREQAELHWLRPGSVWAMDFSHPRVSIDGYLPAIFTVRDLASQQQLLWLPVNDETAVTVIDCLHELFDEHGAPLVVKCDNGPGFVAQAMKQFLCDWSVVTLYSPPYAPWYNGAIERANRSLKEATEHAAEQAGHAGYWTSPDLHQARLQLNRLRRPWGAEGPTPEEKWESRDSLTMDERDVLFEKLDVARRALCREREVDSDGPLDHRLESELIRLALQPVLESSGYLYVTRRRITPELFRRKCDKIM
jgi:transposase InsO family protein